MSLHIPTIRTAAREGRIRWRYHSLVRASQRGISRQQALRVILEGDMIEQRPRSRPFPKGLMMGLIEQNRPLYVSLAYNCTTDYIYIITVHWLDPAKWDDPWTRKRRNRTS